MSSLEWDFLIEEESNPLALGPIESREVGELPIPSLGSKFSQFIAFNDPPSPPESHGIASVENKWLQRFFFLKPEGVILLRLIFF